MESVFYVKTPIGEIVIVPYDTNHTLEDIRKIMKSFLPDLTKWWEPYWFPLCPSTEEKKDEKEEEIWYCPEPLLPKKDELICLVARVVPARIICTDHWYSYDMTHERWFMDITAVIGCPDKSNTDVLIIDFRYYKTDMGEFYYRQYETQQTMNGVNPYVSQVDCLVEDESSGKRLIAFPPQNKECYLYPSFHELIWSVYLELRNDPLHFYSNVRKHRDPPSEAVMEVWCRQLAHEWKEKLHSTRNYRYDTPKPTHLIEDYHLYGRNR